MNIYTFASLFATLSCVAIALFVLLEDRKSHLIRSFALISLLTGVWTLFPYLVSVPKSENTALFFARFVYIFAALVPTAFCYFVLVLLGLEKQRKQIRIINLLFAISIVFSLVSFHEDFIRGVVRYQPFFAVIPGPLFFPFILFFVKLTPCRCVVFSQT